jgi:hypothetical protein
VHKTLPQLRLVPRRDPQLQSVNENIARLESAKPHRAPYATFSLAARLASEAIQAVMELKEMPGVDPKDFQPVLDFWQSAQDYNRVAAVNCAGGNQSLAEALVTFRLLRSIGK